MKNPRQATRGPHAAAASADRTAYPAPAASPARGTRQQLNINSLSQATEAGICSPHPPGASLPLGTGLCLGERQRPTRPFPSEPHPHQRPPHLVDVLPHPLPQPLQVHPPAPSVGEAERRRSGRRDRRASSAALRTAALLTAPRRGALPAPAAAKPAPLPSRAPFPSSRKHGPERMVPGALRAAGGAGISPGRLEPSPSIILILFAVPRSTR